MAPGPQTQAKRIREQARLEKRRVKDARRAARKAARQTDQPAADAGAVTPSE
jgi:hypothetical protein